MGDAMLVGDSEKKGLKRKREKQKFEGLTVEERESWVKKLNEELESLWRYFNEVMSSDVGLQSHFSSVTTSVNAMIAVLLEEKSASYSKLVNEVYEKLKERESGVTITIANVKSSVLYVGQRVAYGVSKPDVDILEDETGSSLWCWETRDMKFLPSSVRGALKIRRIFRKKINERITAILDVISSLQNSEGDSTSTLDMAKAVEKLSKALSEANIRKFVESLALKKDSEMAEKEVKRKAIALMKELEKEKKKMDREFRKEKLQSEKEKEKERKRLQQEAEKDEKRREKEESELRKQLKRKQEEAEREQRRREKEEAELKKQRSVQKQASVMERFLKRSKTSEISQNDQSPITDSNVNMNESALESVFLQMDSALQHNDEFDVEEIRKSHMDSWRRLGDSIRVNNKQHWGLRQKPKMQLIKELKLTSNKEPIRDDDLCIDSMVDGWEQTSNDDKSSHTKTNASLPAIRNCVRRKQLLQFDKSNRPAFYGIWPKKSRIIGPRHPQKKDPELDYDIDSDEEWEEEEPGESLSDSEKEEEETLDEVSLKADEDEESDDGFFVPDGYLSDNEGVETDRNRNNDAADVTDSSPSGKPEAESEDCSGWIRQQKYLHRLTEHALKKNQPLIILNLMHEKAQLLSSEDLSGAPKVEQMCLQALTMCAFPGGLSIELPSDNNLQEEKQEASTPGATGVAISISDSELREIVSVINSSGQGMHRVLESLQQRFPAIPKSHMRNKVRDISDFIDNRWKVKKEILNKLGMSISPDKSGRTKSIATFFSKRCLPPAGHPCESSPESIKRSSSNQQEQP